MKCPTQKRTAAIEGFIAMARQQYSSSGFRRTIFWHHHFEKVVFNTIRFVT
jgi:hypothetical protein